MRGQQNFERYVREKWFPNHRLELRARETYHYYLEKWVIPWFRHMRLIEVMPDDIREFVTDLERQGVTASSIGYCVTILSAIFTTALNGQAVFFHPCRGVSVPTVAKKVRQIITPEQYDLLYQALGEERWQLLVETDIETGLRWGELTELRPKDFSFDTRRINVTRVVIEVPIKFHPTGGRFLVKDYPKDNEHRVVSISAELAGKIEAFIARRGIRDDDLIFTRPPQTQKPPRLRAVPDKDQLPPILRDGVATKYKHGTISGYSGAMKCRCDECTGAYADYRWRRRREDKDRPVRPYAVPDPDGHLPRRWFTENVWQPARTAAKLSDGVKVHSLRHAHASWLQRRGHRPGQGEAGALLDPDHAEVRAHPAGLGERRSARRVYQDPQPEPSRRGGGAEGAGTMNPGSRRLALYGIGVIAVLASIDALAHSYAGLYEWALLHRMSGWEAWSWPAEIDVFLVAGELALYVAFLEAWPARQRLWPWVTALTGLLVSVAGNVGHIQAVHGTPVTVADRVTAAVSPLAAFAGLMIGLLVLKMNGRRGVVLVAQTPDLAAVSDPRRELLADAARLMEEAQLDGQTLSRRALAVQLRARGHRFSNEMLRELASIERCGDTAA